MKTLNLTPELYSYVTSHGDCAHPALEALRIETAKHPRFFMQVSQDQGMFMHILTKAIGAKQLLEIGCFTGYSAICMATALPVGGKLVTLDVDPEATAIAKRYFKAADIEDRIDLRLQPACDELPKIAKQFGHGTFDMAFIDADKANLWNYFEHCLELVRTGGLILVDNVLWKARVIDHSDQTPDTLAVRAFNDRLRDDGRCRKVMLGISDGLTIAQKK